MIKQNFFLSMFLFSFLVGCSQDAPESIETKAAPIIPAYIVLNEDLAQLITDFNAHQGKVRQLFIVGPTCGICLRGMADLHDEYVKAMQNEPRLHTFVVHVPTLGAEEKDVAPTIPLLNGPRVTHYWDEGGHSGLDFQKVLKIDMYAWDVWFLFDPDVIWEHGSVAPEPNFWQHQLGSLNRSQKLDKAVFAKEVKRQINLLPETTIDNVVANTSEQSDSNMIQVAQPRGVIMGQHIRMRGGYRQLKTISSVTYTGFTESDGQRYPLIVETHRPNTLVRTIEKDAHTAKVRWDGVAASYSDESLMLIPKTVLDDILSSFDFDGWIVEWKDKGYEMWRLGMKKVGDKLPWVSGPRRSG